MKLGVSFSGGGVRSAAQLGIMQALLDAGLKKPTIYTGTSGGSIVAALLALGNSPNEALEKFKQTNGIMDIAYWHITKGLFTKSDIEGVIAGSKLEKALVKIFENKNVGAVSRDDKQINSIAIIATEITNGMQVVFTNTFINRTKINDDNHFVVVCNAKKIAPIVRASCSLPGIFIPKHYDGMKLVDGGLTNNLPSDIAFGLGAERVLSIDLGYSGMVENIGGIYSIAKQSIDIMMERIVDINRADHDIYLNPEIYDVKVLETDRIDECFERGYIYGTIMSGRVIQALDSGSSLTLV